MICRIAILGVAFTLFGTALTARTNSTVGAKKHHGIHGVVTEVDKSGFKIKVHHKKKSSVAEPAQEIERSFHVGNQTKIVKVTGPKGQRQRTPATLGDIQKGEHVVVVTNQGKPEFATLILIRIRQ